MTRRGRPPGIGRETMVAAALEVLRERGVARFTTREVAQRAGVSEGSIFYHFGDRQTLMTAVFENALRPLFEFADDMDAGVVTDLDGVRTVLDGYMAASRAFLDEGLDVLFAVHGDAAIRDDVHAFMRDHDYGPHRGTERVARFLRTAQQAGIVDGSIDARVVAHLVISEIYSSAAQPKLSGHHRGAIPRSDVLDTVMRLLEPADLAATTRT